MAGSIELRLMTPDDFGAAFGVARSLPEWFNDQGMKQIAEDLQRQPGGVAEVHGDVIGFVTWTFGEDGRGEIGWIAVAPDHHREGIGGQLLGFAEQHLRDSGVGVVFVETLGESVDYEPYERTRSFYRAAGFRDFKSVKTDNPGMPESLTLRKQLTPPSPSAESARS